MNLFRRSSHASCRLLQNVRRNVACIHSTTGGSNSDTDVTDMYSIPKSWRFSGTQERAPIHLIPTKEKEKPPRFSQQKTFTDIEEELRKPVTERQLPTRDIQAQMRNFGSMPDKEKIKSTKGKLKASIKRMHMDTESLQKSALKVCRM